MLIRLFQPVVFDGKTLEGEIETNGTAISAESIIQRGWGVEIKSSKASKPSKASQEPVESESPSEDPDQDQSDESDELDEPQDEQPSEPPVVVDASVKQIKPVRRASRSKS
jgi:hypothetical protein